MARRNEAGATDAIKSKRSKAFEMLPMELRSAEHIVGPKHMTPQVLKS